MSYYTFSFGLTRATILPSANKFKARFPSGPWLAPVILGRLRYSESFRASSRI
jgi:hypothetical protein